MKKLFRFSDWPMCVTKRVFTWVKSIRKTQYLYNKVQKCAADRAMERVPLHDREMEISIQYHVMLIRQSNDQILMRCYIKGNVN